MHRPGYLVFLVNLFCVLNSIEFVAQGVMKWNFISSVIILCRIFFFNLGTGMWFNDVE